VRLMVGSASVTVIRDERTREEPNPGDSIYEDLEEVGLVDCEVRHDCVDYLRS
jgi:hypothetical protein